MNIGISECNGIYQVEARFIARSDRWMRWHTLRQFVDQSDAILFRDWMKYKGSDNAERYSKSFDANRVVTSVEWHGDSVTLKTERYGQPQM